MRPKNQNAGKYRIRNANGWDVQSGEMMKLLGLRPGAHLPLAGMPAREIQGITVWVTAATPQPYDQNMRRSKSSTHRVLARCPGCQQVVSAGRLHQHVCKSERTRPGNARKQEQ